MFQAVPWLAKVRGFIIIYPTERCIISDVFNILKNAIRGRQNR